MDKDSKPKQPQTQLVPAREKKKSTFKWHLSEHDKKFLRSCNIKPS